MSVPFERLNVFATAEEIAFIKNEAAQPIMAFSDPGGGPPIPMGDPIKAAHAAALRHGLPEIPGYYGIDLSNGEFIRATS